jgi:hypothetical protein
MHKTAGLGLRMGRTRGEWCLYGRVCLLCTFLLILNRCLVVTRPTGSGLHAMRALSQPRWEDFEYERLDKVRNRFYWLGDGQTVSEKTMEGNRECTDRLRICELTLPVIQVPGI